MVVSGTLYTYPDNFRAFKALIAAQYAGSNVTLSPNFVFGETNKTEAFLKKFPSGKVPAFEGSDGVTLSEGNSIAYYVANSQLRGKNEKQQAEILQWISFADLTVTPAASAWLFPIIGIMPFNKQTIDRAKEDTKEFLRILNTHLLTRTYLVGERITLADICVACSLISLYDKLLDQSFRQPYQNTNRWFTTIVNQPQVRAVIGNFELCNKAAEFDPKKYQEFLAKTGGGAAKKDKKEKKEKKEEKPQPAKKEKKPEPEEELDAADAAYALEPKSKDPFDSMPKGTFIMDDFKRCYSNEDESKSIAFFWEKFDPENYSIWLGEYKYSDELAKVFMSCNLITGMFQRLDKMRKQAFASVCLFGEDNNSTISGIWVWRGHDLAFELSPDWQIDYESYSWKKLDASAQTTKDLVTQYFSWTGTDKGGRKFNQGKIFK